MKHIACEVCGQHTVPDPEAIRELLEALENLIEAREWGSIEIWDTAVRQARAAIAKAKGEA